MVTIWPMSSSKSLSCAIKTAATASYSAVPSMLIVAPTGKTNRVILLSTWFFSSAQRNVTGKVAELDHTNQWGKK